MAALARDVRLAWRGLRRTPLFLASIILTLAIGVGANGAVFSILHAVLLQPLPVSRSGSGRHGVERVGSSDELAAGNDDAPGSSAWHDESKDVFEDVAAFKLWAGNLEVPDRSDHAGGRRTVARRARDAELLHHPRRDRRRPGRVFTAEDEAAGAKDLAVLSHGLWQRAFAGDASVVGRSVTFITGRAQRGPRPLTIVGVLPPTFRFTYPRDTELWVLQPWSEIRQRPGRAITHNGAVGRLRPGGHLRAGAEPGWSRSASRPTKPHDRSSSVR